LVDEIALTRRANFKMFYGQWSKEAKSNVVTIVGGQHEQAGSETY